MPKELLPFAYSSLPTRTSVSAMIAITMAVTFSRGKPASARSRRNARRKCGSAAPNATIRSNFSASRTRDQRAW